MKWVNAICTLMLALALLTGPAVAGDQRDLSNLPPPGGTSLKAGATDGGGVFTTFGDPDDVIDGNRSRLTPPLDGEKEDASSLSWWEDLLLLLLRLQIKIIP